MRICMNINESHEPDEILIARPFAVSDDILVGMGIESASDPMPRIGSFKLPVMTLLLRPHTYTLPTRGCQMPLRPFSILSKHNISLLSRSILSRKAAIITPHALVCLRKHHITNTHTHTHTYAHTHAHTCTHTYTHTVLGQGHAVVIARSDGGDGRFAQRLHRGRVCHVSTQPHTQLPVIVSAEREDSPFAINFA